MTAGYSVPAIDEIFKGYIKQQLMEGDFWQISGVIF